MSEPRRLRWIALALFVSIAANCLTVGLLLGQHGPALFGDDTRRAAAGAGQNVANVGARVAQLPDAERRKFLMAMRPYRPQIRAARAALADAREKLAEAIAAKDYDQAAVAAAFADVRQHTAAVQEKVQEAAAVALGVLDESSRKALVAGAIAE